MNSRVDLAKLRLFVEVLDAGSITAGAARCHLSVGAASAKLQDLEQALGVTVFVRGKSGVAPTAAGLELAAHARSVLTEVEVLHSEMAPFSRGIRGRVKLLANTAALSAYLPSPLAKFLSGHPEIDIDLQEMWTGEIIDALRRKKGDVGVLADTMDTTGLYCSDLADDALVVVGSERRMHSLPSTPSLADCLSHSMVGLSAQSALYTYLQVKASALGKAIHYRVRMRTFEGVLTMADLDVGISVVSSLAIKDLLGRYENLVFRPLNEDWAKRRLILCTHHDVAEAPAYIKALIEFLTSGTQRQSW